MIATHSIEFNRRRGWEFQTPAGNALVLRVGVVAAGEELEPLQTRDAATE
jgi:hypothetical protein